MKFKGLLKVALLLVAVSALFVACDTLAGGRFPHVETVYMKPGEDWASDKPVYAAWMWTDGKEGSWTELTKSTIEEDLWEVAVPSEIDNIIFVKMKDGTTKDKFSWDTKEEQTADLKVPYVFDNVQVYSIKAKEWIAIGAEEKEPEPEPVLDPVAISATEFTSLKYAAQSNPTDIELDGEKSFTFYASSKTYKFKYTNGTWDFTAVTGEAIAELDKEYPIVKKGNTGYDNIELKNLQDGVEYKVSLTHKDGFAYVKVTKTGNAITTLPEVYSYTVKKANISDDWGGKPEKAAFGVLLLTDTELAEAKAKDPSNKDVYDYLGGAETKLNVEANLLVYTHENGSFTLKDAKGTTFENVAAVVTDDSITVYVKVSGTLVEKGKKAYVVALDKNDTPIINMEKWNTSLAAMNANATWPAGELKENKEPDDAPKGYFKLTHVAGSFNSWGDLKLDADKSFEYTSKGNSDSFKFKPEGTFNDAVGRVKINAAGTFTLNSEDTDKDGNILLNLPAGIYKIKLDVTAQDSAKVVVTKTGEYVPPEFFFEGADIAGAMGELSLTKVDDNTVSAKFVYNEYTMNGKWNSTTGNVHFILRESAPNWNPRYADVTFSADNTFVECIKSSDDSKHLVVNGLETGNEYEITFKHENGKVYVKVRETGEFQEITPPTDCGIVYTPEEGYVYVYSTDWVNAGAVIGAYVWNPGSDGVWKAMTAVDGVDNLVKVEVEGYSMIIFRRYGPDQVLSWDTKDDWGGKTGDLNLPTDNKVVAVISGWTGDNNVTVNWLTFATE